MSRRTEDQAAASTLQRAGMAYARHAAPGEPIEIVVVVGGRAHVVAITDRHAADMIGVIAGGISSNMISHVRRELTALPKAGSRT